LERRVRIDPALREQYQAGFHLPVAGPGLRHRLPLLRMPLASQGIQPGDLARRTMPILCALAVLSVPKALRRHGDSLGASAMTVRVRARRRLWIARFGFRGHGVLGNGNAVSVCPSHLLLEGEARTMCPALYGRPTTASAVLARVTFPRAGSRGRRRQRDTGTGQNLLRNEQPGERPSQGSCADQRHTSLCPGNGSSEEYRAVLDRTYAFRSSVVRSDIR
jgi:hypothetical protein